MKKWYEVLGVEPSANEDEILSGFKRKMMERHRTANFNRTELLEAYREGMGTTSISSRAYHVTNRTPLKPKDK